MSVAEYKAIQRPPTGGVFKKVFFQLELRSIKNGDAIFGLVAYGAHHRGGKVISPPFSLHDVEGDDYVVDGPPLSIGNLEIPKRNGKGAGKVLQILRSYIKYGKKGLNDIQIVLLPFLTENPHASYDITIDGTTELLNPSPPAPPSDY